MKRGTAAAAVNDEGTSKAKRSKKQPEYPLGVLSPTPMQPTDFQGIRAALDDVGVCVVADILTMDEQERFLTLFWEAVERRHRILRRNDSSTWTDQNTDWQGTYGCGQYKHYGMAQEAHCWLIRANETIRRIFEAGVFQNQSCCVSLDGCAALFRPCVSKLQSHVDLVAGLDGASWGSVQGAYNLYEVSAEVSASGAIKASAGFVCVPKSHTDYSRLWEERTASKGFKMPAKHWHQLEADSPLQEKAVLVTSPANSLVLWRSDLLHKNYGGDFSYSGSGRLARLTQFVCYQPKKYRSEKVLLKKAECVLDGASGNHWAALGHREPIVPFPAWSAGAKAIKQILPFVSDSTLTNSTLQRLAKNKSKKQRTSVEKQEILDALPASVRNIL